MTATAPCPALPAAPGGAVLDDPVELPRYTRYGSSDAGVRIAESWFRLGGMHCAACAGVIESALQRVDGVLEARVNAAAQRVMVRWNPARTQASTLARAVAAAGYEAVPDTTSAARALRLAEGRRLLWRLFVASFCAMQVMMMATPAYVAGPGELAPDMAGLLNWGAWFLTLPVLCFAAAPFFSGAWHALRSGRIGMDVPVALGIVVAFVAGSASTFDPTGPFGAEPSFDSLTMFVSFLLLGRYLELKARHRATERLEAASGALPETAIRLDERGQSETVSTRRLAVGDLVAVSVGAAFPADGVLMDAGTEADESLLSGEPRPVAKRAGDAVVGGSVNVGAPVVARLTHVGLDTRYEAIVALVRDAMSQRPASVHAADRWAGPFLWGVLLLAGGAAWMWHGIDPSRAAKVAVAVLIVTCPCALSLATPAALLSAASGLARRGILLRRLDVLETLARVTHVFMDKTGTLTDRAMVVSGSQLLLRAGPAEAAASLDAACALAAHSLHPLSQAMCRWRSAGGPVPAWIEVREQPGAGLEAVDAEGMRWRLGSAAWLHIPHADDLEGRHVWFGPLGRPMWRFTFQERTLPEAEATVRVLQDDGVRVTLLSGDSQARVSHLARRLGIHAAIGDASPERKLAALREAQQGGARVAMVGDGINDAPVLAQADVSFAMDHGAAVARLHADAVVLSHRIDAIASAWHLARRTDRVIRQNLAWSALYNLACVPLAVAGLLPPWAAGLGMAASSLLVVLNASRLAR